MNNTVEDLVARFENKDIDRRGVIKGKGSELLFGAGLSSLVPSQKNNSDPFFSFYSTT